jgi:hypothetical protein
MPVLLATRGFLVQMNKLPQVPAIRMALRYGMEQLRYTSLNVLD